MLVPVFCAECREKIRVPETRLEAEDEGPILCEDCDDKIETAEASVTLFGTRGGRWLTRPRKGAS